MSSIKLKARNLMTFTKSGSTAQWKKFGCATSCDLSLESEMIETAGRYSGSWREYLKGMKSWEITCSALMVKSETYNDFITYFDGTTTIYASVGSVAEHDDGEPTEGFTPDGAFGRGGQAYVKSITFKGETTGFATLDIVLQGTGELEEISKL
jgi:predicted secreted protein